MRQKAVQTQDLKFSPDPQPFVYSSVQFSGARKEITLTTKTD